MSRRLVSALSVGLVLLLVGCTEAPRPLPTRNPAAATPSPTMSPTPEVATPPEAAFDIDCATIAAEIDPLIGVVSAPVQDRLGEFGPNWYPGPPLYMFSRAGGIACSAESDAETRWEVTLVPGGQAVVDDVTRKDSFYPSSCLQGGCGVHVQDGDLLLSAQIDSPRLSERDFDRVNAALTRLAARAVEGQRDVEVRVSPLAGAGCARILPAERVAEIWDSPADVVENFDGWSVPAYVYAVVGGSTICSYEEEPGSYDGAAYLLITVLPAGAWAYPLIDGRTSTEVSGADSAMMGEDVHGHSFLDLRVGEDWIRLTSYDGSAERLHTAATSVAEHLTVPTPAPR